MEEGNAPMQITLDVPEDILRALGEQPERFSRTALEMLAIEGYRSRRLSEGQVRRLLGFETRYQVHGFLKEHGVEPEFWMESPTLRLIGEEAGYWGHLRSAVTAGKAVGPLVHDARVVAICRARGIREVWTTDRDFSRFPGLVTRNPLPATP